MRAFIFVLFAVVSAWSGGAFVAKAEPYVDMVPVHVDIANGRDGTRGVAYIIVSDAESPIFAVFDDMSDCQVKSLGRFDSQFSSLNLLPTEATFILRLQRANGNDECSTVAELKYDHEVVSVNYEKIPFLTEEVFDDFLGSIDVFNKSKGNLESILTAQLSVILNVFEKKPIAWRLQVLGVGRSDLKLQEIVFPSEICSGNFAIVSADEQRFVVTGKSFALVADYLPLDNKAGTDEAWASTEGCHAKIIEKIVSDNGEDIERVLVIDGNEERKIQHMGP